MWMAQNNLKLNDSKTEFLTLGRKLELTKIGGVQITIGGEAIPSMSVVRNIGVMFDATIGDEGAYKPRHKVMLSPHK